MASQPDQNPAGNQGSPDQHHPITRRIVGFVESFADWKLLKGILAIVTILTVVLGVFHALDIGIDKAVERKLSDPTILKKIAARSRPMLIFDGSGHIVADLGAGESIPQGSLKIIKTDERYGWPLKIKIDFNRSFSDAPLMTCTVPGSLDSIIAAGSDGYSWEFDVPDMQPPNLDKSKWRFRLELFP